MTHMIEKRRNCILTYSYTLTGRRHRQGAEGGEKPVSRHRPRPRGRGDLLACPGDAGGQEGAERRQGPADHASMRSPGAPSARRSAPARPRPAADRGIYGATGARLPGRLHPLAGVVAQAARQPLAGRVQSVALRLICEREAEIEVFKAREYWTIEAVFITPGGAPFTARLTHLNGKRLDQFDLNTQTLAKRRRRWSNRAVLGRLGGAQAGPPQSATAVHHLDIAAGSLSEVGFARSRRCGARSNCMKEWISMAKRPA